MKGILGLIEEEVKDWEGYSPQEKMAYFVAGLTNKGCVQRYKAIERNLSKKVEEQSKYILNGPAEEIIEALEQEGFEVKSKTHEKYVDHYYDTEDCELSKQNYIIRVREKEDGTFEGTFKEMIESNTPQALHNVATVQLQTCDVEELIRRLQEEKGISNPLFKMIKNYPRFRIDIDRTSYELASGTDRGLHLATDHCEIFDIDVNEIEKLKLIEEFDKLEARHWGRKDLQDLARVCEALGSTSTKKTNCQIGFDSLEKQKETRER